MHYLLQKYYEHVENIVYRAGIYSCILQVLRHTATLCIYKKRTWLNDAVFLKGTVSRDFLLLVFFGQPQSIAVGSFRISSKICKSRRTTGVNDTGGKVATGINDTGGKFFHQFR
jgi:hypothetical protein